MTKRLEALFLSSVILLAATLVCGAEPQGAMSFTVSMEQPTTHYYHVVFKCEGLKGETQDFKMPADKIRVLFSRGDAVREIEVVLGKRPERRFSIKPLASPTPLQAEILKSWLGE